MILHACVFGSARHGIEVMVIVRIYAQESEIGASCSYMQAVQKTKVFALSSTSFFFFFFAKNDFL